MSSYGLTKVQEDFLVAMLDNKEIIRRESGVWSADSVEAKIQTVLGMFDRRLVRIRCTAPRGRAAPYLSAVLTTLGARVARDIRNERNISNPVARAA